jgi:hypothetical protein
VLRDLYCSPRIIRIIKSRRTIWAGHVAPEGRRPLGRPRIKCVDNIMMDLEEVGWDSVDWIGLAQDRDKWRALAKTIINLRVP